MQANIWLYFCNVEKCNGASYGTGWLAFMDVRGRVGRLHGIRTVGYAGVSCLGSKACALIDIDNQ